MRRLMGDWMPCPPGFEAVWNDLDQLTFADMAGGRGYICIVDLFDRELVEALIMVSRYDGLLMIGVNSDPGHYHIIRGAEIDLPD